MYGVCINIVCATNTNIEQPISECSSLLSLSLSLFIPMAPKVIHIFCQEVLMMEQNMSELSLCPKYFIVYESSKLSIFHIFNPQKLYIANVRDINYVHTQHANEPFHKLAVVHVAIYLRGIVNASCCCYLWYMASISGWMCRIYYIHT